MNNLNPFKFTSEKLPARLNVLVYEPNVIAHMGINHMLASLDSITLYQHSINDLSSVASDSCQFSADVIFISTGIHNHEAIAVLQFLTRKRESGNGTPVVICLGQENPSLANMLFAFGANNVLSPDVSEQKLQHSLTDIFAAKNTDIPVPRLTYRECQVIQRLMSGYTLTQIAAQTRRNVRTVSAQKCKALAKLDMNMTGELQILAGELNNEPR
ncbi:LuxR C-terminal-related transcriptional regulator [Enterobacillus tribolii]|nr:LuxR C-terminal-related transcriptional regulator [Enterobacillus tribolii]MBW7981911.1 response regulator transcription factor [Enterobacillus tribolii]